MKANESPVKVENIPHPSLAMDKTPGTLLNMKKSGKRMFIPQKDAEQLMLTTMKPMLTTIKLWISWGKTHVNHAKKKNNFHHHSQFQTWRWQMAGRRPQVLKTNGNSGWGPQEL